MDITQLTATLKARFEQFRENIFHATERRYVHKNPVADIAALTAIAEPKEGETRQVLSYLPDIVNFTFNATNTTEGEAAADGTAGRWNTADLDIDAGDPWAPSTDYAAGEIFAFETDSTTAVTQDGLAIAPGATHFGEYVDANGEPVDHTSHTTLTVGELAKIRLVAGVSEASDELITQAETDAIFLVD